MKHSQLKQCSHHGALAPGSPIEFARPMQGVRLCQVSPQSEDETKTDVDIIAIHGLDTNSPETWIWDPKGASVNWLEHPDMLPRRFPTARIFTCDWPADLFERPDFISKEFEEFARLLLARIKHRSLATNSHGRGEERAIIFIASCLGGVLLMKTLVMASQEYQSVKRATRGIIFLATPFRGTSFEDVARWAEPGLRAWASIQGKTVSNMLEHVKSSFKLGDLVRTFTEFCRNNDLTDYVFTFYETGKSSLPRKIAPWLPGPFAQEKPLVNHFSGTLDIVPHPLPLDRPHVTMNKFYGPDDPGYVAVVGKIEHILCEVRQGWPIEKADAWIRNKRYSLKELEIERLSGDLLPMDRCYINLAIMEQSAENASGAKKAAMARKASPFSLLTRLKVETLDKAIEITLPTLFGPRQTHNDQHRRPSRILIRGQAGVGKTTLCKKIVHDFTYGEMWQDLFDRVLWVPLRNLKREERRRSPRYNLGSLFHDEYFSQHREGKRLAEVLWHTLEDTKSGKTLFILDGLDEVSQDLDGNMLSFFKELLDQPNVIITSRLHATLPPGVKNVDLELETVGFHLDQVNAYVETAFTDPQTGKTNSETIAEVQSYLQRHQLVQGLMRIPVQLDALCFGWEGFRDKAIPQTMTAVYRAIEQILWKKDVVKLERLAGARVQAALPKEIANFIKKELYLLETLAFTGMYNDVIEFGPKHRDAISGQFNLTDTNLLLDEVLGRLSFMRTSDPSLGDHDRNYHFLHLTFQEYFAARYFVRHWTGKANEPLQYLVFGRRRYRVLELIDLKPIDFLRRHKYNARYDIFWRFVTGLLDARGDKETHRLFDAIETQPLDILGPTHQRLIMHCLSEVQAEITFRKDLEEKLLRWLLFECRYNKYSRLVTEMEFPETVLSNALRSSSEDTRIILLRSLATRPAIESSVMNLLGSWLENNNSAARLKFAVLRALERHNSLPSRVISVLATQLEHEDSDVREAAVDALAGQSALAPEILERVAARLEDEVSEVRCRAGQAFTGQWDLAPEILERVAGRLEDEDYDVRELAVEALQAQSALAPEILEKIAARLEHKNSDVRGFAAEALIGQLVLTPEILEKIAALLDDKDGWVRGAAVSVLTGQSALTPETLEKVAARLDDERYDVRWLVVVGLEGESALKPAIFERVASRLESEDWRVRRAAAETFIDDRAMTPEILERVVARLEDEESDVRGAAAEALTRQSALAPEVLERVAGRLEDEESDVRQMAIHALIDQWDLAPEILERVAGRLEDEESNVRRAAADALTGQSALAPEILERVAGRLEDEDSNVRWRAFNALKGQSALAPKILERLTARLEEEDIHVRLAAVRVLASQSAPTPGILERVAGRLEDEDSDVRQAAVDALAGQSSLAPEILERVAGRLEDEERRVRWKAVKALIGQSALPEVIGKYLDPFYRALLAESFDESFSWFEMDGVFRITTSDREVLFECLPDQIKRAIPETQIAIGAPLPY